MRLHALFAAAAVVAAQPAAAAISYAGNVQVAGATADLSGLGGTGTGNDRLSFGSDLFYDAGSNSFYGITDRGPGGGVYDYAPRVNQFTLGVNSTTGAISNFQQVQTVIFKDTAGTPLTGLAPNLIPGGNSATLGRSFDSEGFVRLANGNFLVSDEYGPSIYEFRPDGTQIRAFTQPANVQPKNGAANDFSGTSLTSGRQDNRGYEGLTVSRDGSKAYAILQDPLVNEGAQNDGRRSRNVRIVEFDIASGTATHEYIYVLEDRATINARLPNGAPTFNATAQGRNIGNSSITALNNGKFLVIERDNRGLGVTDPNGNLTVVGSKRIYIIDITGATDVINTSLANTSTLPVGVTPVQKALFLDVQAALTAAGVSVPEKLEGLTLGPRLDNGGVALILATDNDFSVTQDGSLTQFDVCSSGPGGVSSQVTFGAACPNGQFLIPTNVYSFRIDGLDAVALGVPEPASWALMIGGFAMTGAALRTRRRTAGAA